MRLIMILLLFGMWTFITGGCNSGDGGFGFIPTGRIVAVAERDDSTEVHVGAPRGSITPGRTVTVINTSTGETKTATVEDDGSFKLEFSASTDSIFRVVIEEEGIDETIGVSIIRDAVSRNLAQLGSVPTNIKIVGNRAYVLNGFSDNIQIFDLNQNPPQQIGTITLPSGSDPVDIAFLDNTHAYVVNMIGQSIAMVNLETRQCETIIVRLGMGDEFPPCSNVVLVASAFEDPSGIEIANGKLYVTNSNLDEFFEPSGNGFVTVIDTETNQVIRTISTTGENTGWITAVNGKLYVVNSGNVFFNPDTGEFNCDTESIPSIDIIDPENDTLVDSIVIPLSEQNPSVCLPGRMEPTPDGRFGYMGLGITGALLKVDLKNNTVVNGSENPIAITPLSELNFTADIKIRDDGLGFVTLFNSDQIAVIDTTTDEVNPFPFIFPFPAGLRADNPSSDFFDGVQNLAIRPGVSGRDFLGADIFFITGLSQKLGSVDTTLILPPE